ncbi:MAG TPA: histone deacetylase family protein [Lysobacter sp.]|nr:histone deacetylase family protein [Lysobacter sp.]
MNAPGFRLYSHSACLAHDTGEGHPERPARLTAVLDALAAHFPDSIPHEAPRATHEALLRVHAAQHIARVLETEPGADLHWLDADTALSPGSAEAALRAAGAVVAATDWVLGGERRRAFCAVRPPGHHAEAATAMGFCLFDNVAVGAAHAFAMHGLQRIAIADFDVHHGNGTQAIFEREPRLLFVDTHQMPLYPGTGAATETGVGNIANAPYPPLSNGADVRALWRDALLPRLDAFAPQLLFVSAGFDAHRDDPLAQGLLDADDFGWITAQLAGIAERHARGRIVSTLEGGYDLAALAASAVAHVAALRG